MDVHALLQAGLDVAVAVAVAVLVAVAVAVGVAHKQLELVEHELFLQLPDVWPFGI